MSVYSTKNITREEAIKQIREELARKKDLTELSDKELEDMMFDLFGDERLQNSRLENYRII